MGSGEVDRTWAREHHALWVEKLEREFPDQVGKAPPTPAE
jgi:cytochrome b subunit of formate dehydrogenase